MRWMHPRRLIAVLCGFAVLIVLCFMPVSIAQGDDITPTRARQPAARIVQGTTVQQYFPASGTTITEIGLVLGTYERIDHGTFQVLVEAQRNGRWQTLATKTVAKETLGNAATVSYALPFSPPLAVTMQEPLRITVQSPDEGQANAITWWMNDQETPREGFSMLINNEPQQGQLSFSVAYPHASGRLIQKIGLAWERSTIFLSPGWRAILLFGLGVLCLGVVLATYLLLAKVGAAPPDTVPPQRNLPPDEPVHPA
jgi:hypothetical protein